MSRRRHCPARCCAWRPGRRLLVQLEGTHTIVEAASARDAARVSHHSPSPSLPLLAPPCPSFPLPRSRHAQSGSPRLTYITYTLPVTVTTHSP